jgi:hypothetical protein
MQDKELGSSWEVNRIKFLTDILSAIILKMLSHMNNFIFFALTVIIFK